MPSCHAVPCRGMRKPLLRVFTASLHLYSRCCSGAWRFGACAGLYYGVRELSAVARGFHSVRDTMLAGAVTGAAVGAFCETLSPVG